jgi:putative transposase
MPLKERVYTCPNCKTSLDRDLNASINLKNYASTPSSGETLKKACREVKSLDNIVVETSCSAGSKRQTYRAKSF